MINISFFFLLSEHFDTFPTNKDFLPQKHEKVTKFQCKF